MTMSNPNTCRNCENLLIGRSDKCFCDAYCRNSFNNQNKADDERMIQQTNSIIRKNRRILKTLCPQGKSIVRKEVLDQMGYRFKFYTDTFHSSKGGTYYLCYDFGFTAMYEGSTQKALIINRQDYMDKQEYDPWRNK